MGKAHRTQSTEHRICPVRSWLQTPRALVPALSICVLVQMGCDGRATVTHASLEVLTPRVANGETVTLRWNPGELLERVGADFGRIDSEFEEDPSGLLIETSVEGGYRIEYEMHRTNTRSDGSYRVAVTGESRSGFVIREEGAVELANGSGAALGVSLAGRDGSELMAGVEARVADLTLEPGLPLEIERVTFTISLEPGPAGTQAAESAKTLFSGGRLISAAGGEGETLPASARLQDGDLEFQFHEPYAVEPGRITLGLVLVRNCAAAMPEGTIVLGMSAGSIRATSEGRIIRPVVQPAQVRITIEAPLVLESQTGLSPLPADMIPIGVSDVTGDGLAEIFVSVPGLSKLLVIELRGVGQARVLREIELPVTPRDAGRVADVDRDGLDDFWIEAEDGRLYLLLSGKLDPAGGGAYGSLAYDRSETSSPGEGNRAGRRRIVDGQIDLDGDGQSDLVVADEGSRTQAAGTLTTFLSTQGGGTENIHSGSGIVSRIDLGPNSKVVGMDVGGEGVGELIVLRRFATGIRVELLAGSKGNGPQALGRFEVVDTLDVDGGSWADMARGIGSASGWVLIQEGDSVRTLQVQGPGRWSDGGPIEMADDIVALASVARDGGVEILGRRTDGELVVAGVNGLRQVGIRVEPTVRTLVGDVDGDGLDEFVVAGDGRLLTIAAEEGLWGIRQASGPESRVTEIDLGKGEIWYADAAAGRVGTVSFESGLTLGPSLAVGADVLGLAAVGSDLIVRTKGGYRAMGDSVSPPWEALRTEIAGSVSAGGAEAAALYSPGASDIVLRRADGSSAGELKFSIGIGTAYTAPQGLVAVDERGEILMFGDPTSGQVRAGRLPTKVGSGGVDRIGGEDDLVALAAGGEAALFTLKFQKEAVEPEEIIRVRPNLGNIGAVDAFWVRDPANPMAGASLLIGSLGGLAMYREPAPAPAGQSSLGAGGNGGECRYVAPGRVDRMITLPADARGRRGIVVLDSSLNQVTLWRLR